MSEKLSRSLFLAEALLLAGPLSLLFVTAVSNLYISYTAWWEFREKFETFVFGVPLLVPFSHLALEAVLRSKPAAAWRLRRDSPGVGK
jgi:hypothetical protein